MAITSTRNVQIGFSGDVAQLPQPFSALDNLVSPGQSDLVTLASGANTITPPSVTGTTATALTIIPPAGNATLITLKGVTGDTGVPLHKTDPTSIAADTTLSSIVLTAAATIAGVRLIWS